MTHGVDAGTAGIRVGKGVVDHSWLPPRPSSRAYRLALSNVEGHPERAKSVKQGKRIGKVAKGGCEGGDALSMVLYQPQAGAADDPEEERVGVPFTGDWAITGCDYPDDKRTVNQYRGVLVPCPPEDDTSREG